MPAVRVRLSVAAAEISTKKVAMTRKPVSSQSTGNAGAFFENEVGAIMLGRLLRGAHIPVGRSEPLVRVGLQRRNADCPLDDIVAYAGPDDNSPRIQFQVKKNIDMIASDKAFVVVVGAMLEVVTENPEEVSTGNLLMGLAAPRPAGQLAELADLTRRARTHEDPGSFLKELVPGATSQAVRNRYEQFSSAVGAVAVTSDPTQVALLSLQILSALHVWQVSEGEDGADWRDELDNLSELAKSAGKSAADLMAQLHLIAAECAPQAGVFSARRLRAVLSARGTRFSHAGNSMQQGAVFNITVEPHGRSYSNVGNQYNTEHGEPQLPAPAGYEGAAE
jgi:hypothetical protein